MSDSTTSNNLSGKDLRKQQEAEVDAIFCSEQTTIIPVDLEKEMKKCVHSYQGSYLLYKYGITKKAMEKYKRMDSDSLKSLLLRILMDHQPTILAKYIQSLRFMIHIIEGLPNDFDKKDYYLHISCLTGRQEQLFLSCFKEFEVVTNNEY